DAGNAWEIHAAASDGSRGEWLSTDYGNGFRTNLDQGDYVLVARHGNVEIEVPVTITQGEVTAPLVVLNAGTVVVRPRPSEGADVDSGAAVEFALPDGSVTTGYGEVAVILPAGEQDLTVRLGQGSISESFVLAAGETIEKDVVVGVGRA